MILADYNPKTQRTDKFGLDLQRTRAETIKKTSTPFFNFYLQKYADVPLSVFILDSVLKKVIPNFSASFNTKRNLIKAVDAQSNLNASSLKLIKDKSSFQLIFLSLTITVDFLEGFLFGKEAGIYKASEKEKYAGAIESLKTVFSQPKTFKFLTKDLKTPALKENALKSLDAVSAVVLSSDGDKISIVVSVKMNKEDAVFLTGGLKFELIRPLDLYPILVRWIANNGAKGATITISPTRIASALSKNHVMYAKSNEHNLLISNEGNILYVPRELNKTRDYEDAYTKFCTSPDNDDFTLKNGEGKKLPANMEVLVDWTNAKYLFSNAQGALVTFDLSQCRRLTCSAVINVFQRREFNEGWLKTLYTYATKINYQPKPYVIDPETHIQETVFDYYNIVESVVSDLTWYDLCDLKELRPIYNWMTDIIQAINLNPEPLYEYAISNLMETRGLFQALLVYGGNNWQNTLDIDSRDRAPAINQGVDKDWALPSIPMLASDIGAMPHQKRVLNKLKDNPKFAILPVQAGGGKTPLAIIEILYQIKSGRNAPYIVLCPSQLVAQYVQEVARFTAGQLNVIPITTKIVKRNGFDYLQTIFNSAPRNTLVVASYDAIKYAAHEIGYGVTTVVRFPVVEFLRQFGFGYAICDESHLLKNEKSIRANAVRMLLSEVPCIRLASGTLAYNNVTDLVGQTQIMDPSVFGSMHDFDNEYSIYEGKRRIGLRPGAEKEINDKLSNNLVIAGAERREWAAMLPTPVTNYHLVQLTAEESEQYQELLSDVIEELKSNENIKNQLELIKKLREKGEIEEDILDEMEDKIGRQIQPYIQRLERFIASPARETGNTDFLEKPSAKIEECINLLKEHINSGIFGKVIVFTENVMSAEEVFRYASNDKTLKNSGLLYKASEKVALLNKFNKDSKIKWMVGVEQSINTGLNLQEASRIIRFEYPWAPGAVEQGDARILRPQTKKADQRSKVYFDWIIADGTVDTLKVGRLMSKSVQIAKFENPADPEYQKIGVEYDPIQNKQISTIPLIRLSIGALSERFMFQETNGAPGDMMPYFDAMKEMHHLRVKSFAEYREKHKDELDANGKLKMESFIVEKAPKDASYLQTPYCEGMNLYAADKLGLIRLDEYFNQAIKNGEDDGLGYDDAIDLAIEALADHSVWTEYGESILVNFNFDSFTCNINPMGTYEKILLSMSEVFVISKNLAKGKTISEEIAHANGMKVVIDPTKEIMPISTNKLSNAEQRRLGLDEDYEDYEEEPEEEEVEEVAIDVDLQLIAINGLLGFRFLDIKNEDAVSILEQLGFSRTIPHYRAKIKNYNALERWLKKVANAGYKFKEPYNYADAWAEIAKTMKRKALAPREEYRATDKLIVKIANANDLKDMTRWEIKPSKDKNCLRVQPMFSANGVYATMPSQKLYNHCNKIKSLVVPGIKWELGPDGYEKVFYSPKEAINLIKKMTDMGLAVADEEDLIDALKHCKQIRFKEVK